jgi:transposase
MRPKGTSAELERRRRRAVELVDQGESPTVVARILGVHLASIHRWRRMARKPHGLDPKPIPGRPRRFADYHLHKLERLLLHGTKKHGWPNQLWTADRVSGLIRERFGMSLHPEHVRKILKKRLGWTSQKPKRKARERDDKTASHSPPGVPPQGPCRPPRRVGLPTDAIGAADAGAAWPDAATGLLGPPRPYLGH